MKDLTTRSQERREAHRVARDQAGTGQARYARAERRRRGGAFGNESQDVRTQLELGTPSWAKRRHRGG